MKKISKDFRSEHSRDLNKKLSNTAKHKHT